MTLEEAREHVGSGVVYRAHPEAPYEDGTITEVRGDYVFVLYVGDRAPKATHPESLQLLSGGAPS